MRLSFVASLLAISFLITSCTRKNKQSDETYENYVILVSFDGFRWDYTDLYDTPNFDDMALDGVKAERLIPSFPTKTFPNDVVFEEPANHPRNTFSLPEVFECPLLFPT